MLHFFDELRKRYESYLKKICKEGNRQFFFLYKKMHEGVIMICTYFEKADRGACIFC